MLSEYSTSQTFLRNAGRDKNVDGSKGLSDAGDQIGNRAKNAAAAKVLLVSPDSVLVLELERVFGALSLTVKVAADVETGMEAMEHFGTKHGSDAVGSYVQCPSVVLLDARLPGIGSGRLLASVHESGVHQRCAVALIAEEVSDEWIARLREGVIDDIVPRHSDVATWRTHISTMQRGHALAQELEQMREVSALELERDRVSGTFNGEAMMSILFRETDRVQRLHGTLSLVMVDVDDYSHWLKELGQKACERMLREIAERTSRLLRSYDVLGRMHGNEFLILLPGCSTINGTMLVDRIRLDVFGEPFLVTDGPGVGNSIKLTASFAITASRGRSPVVVVREAEATMIQAKLDGPDSLRCAGELPGNWNSNGEDLATLYPGGEAVVW